MVLNLQNLTTLSQQWAAVKVKKKTNKEAKSHKTKNQNSTKQRSKALQNNKQTKNPTKNIFFFAHSSAGLANH